MKLGASSSGWFSDVVQGRIGLTGKSMLGLSRLLQHAPQEEDFFKELVHFAQSASHEERTSHMQKILSFKQIKADIVGRDKFEYYTKWYYAALREVLFIHEFRGDHAELAKRLNPPITPAQARKAVALLKNLEFIADDGTGRWVPTQNVLKKDPQFQTLHWANFQKANLELALSALERFSKQDRDISSLSLVLSMEEFETARGEILRLRKRLIAMTGDRKPGDRVYQCNFQVFPISQ